MLSYYLLILRHNSPLLFFNFNIREGGDYEMFYGNFKIKLFLYYFKIQKNFQNFLEGNSIIGI